MKGGDMNRKSLIVVIAVVVVLFVAGVLYSVLQRPDTEPDGAPAITGADRAEEARGVIAEIRQQQRPVAAPPPGGVEPSDDDADGAEPAGAEPAPGAASASADAGGPGAASAGAAQSDLDEAFERAQAFQREGKLADAQLLYFFGARGGHPASAFELAAMNDPNHHSPEASLLAEPDAFQAYRWYSVANEQAYAGAADRLAALREWAENAAQSGDAEAEQLLLQWE
jgi:hypothetical protein